MIKIYHNNRCAKSRETLDLIRKNGKEPEIVPYLTDVPSEKELKDILKKLKIKPEQLVRKKEILYKEKFSTKKLTDAEWIKVMIKNPVLIERPIVINGNKAIIGRPPEKVLEIL